MGEKMARGGAVRREQFWQTAEIVKDRWCVVTQSRVAVRTLVLTSTIGSSHRVSQEGARGRSPGSSPRLMDTSTDPIIIRGEDHKAIVRFAPPAVHPRSRGEYLVITIRIDSEPG